jgi:hypothetical protein
MWRPLMGFVGGSLYWLLMMVLAVVPGGGGHGWMAPAMVSLPGIILIPLTGGLLFISSTASEGAQRRTIVAARVIMCLAIVLDVGVVVVTATQGRDFLQREPGASTCFVLAMPWAAMWVFWHAIVMRIAAERM